jgi:hypothetical protein
MSLVLTVVLMKPPGSRRRPRDGLGLEVLVEALDTVLPPDTAALVAAEGHVSSVGGATVDID